MNDQRYFKDATFYPIHFYSIETINVFKYVKQRFNFQFRNKKIAEVAKNTHVCPLQGTHKAKLDAFETDLGFIVAYLRFR